MFALLHAYSLYAPPITCIPLTSYLILLGLLLSFLCERVLYDKALGTEDQLPLIPLLTAAVCRGYVVLLSIGESIRWHITAHLGGGGGVVESAGGPRTIRRYLVS